MHCTFCKSTNPFIISNFNTGYRTINCCHHPECKKQLDLQMQSIKEETNKNFNKKYIKLTQELLKSLKVDDVLYSHIWRHEFVITNISVNELPDGKTHAYIKLRRMYSVDSKKIPVEETTAILFVPSNSPVTYDYVEYQINQNNNNKGKTNK